MVNGFVSMASPLPSADIVFFSQAIADVQNAHISRAAEGLELA
jgi:hypothetical protein